MVRTRNAVLPDVEQIHAIIRAYSGNGTLLPRTLAELRENVRDFVVAEDNGKIVGCLGGVLDKSKNCVGGAAFVSHGVGYNTWLPSAAARYRVQGNWSVYAQFGEGNVIPPTSVFDVPGALVERPPNPTLAKTYQTGSVLKFNRWILDANFYYIHFQNPYAAVNDPNNANDAMRNRENAASPIHTGRI